MAGQGSSQPGVLRGRARKLLSIAAAAVLGWAALALALDAWIGVSQPVLGSERTEGVLYTYDEAGREYATRLVVLDDGPVQWVQSGHHFRGWYERLLVSPEVELERGGARAAYRAVPVDTPETEARVVALLKERAGAGFYVIRAVLLYADIKPVRLDPR